MVYKQSDSNSGYKFEFVCFDYKMKNELEIPNIKQNSKYHMKGRKKATCSNISVERL